MALAFPLTLTDFQETIRVRDAMPFKPRRAEQISGLGTGQILTAEIAPPAWEAEFALVDVPRGEGARIVGLLEALGSTNRLRLYDPSVPFPQADPEGDVLVSNDGLTVLALGGNGRSLRVAGLPSSYTLSAGDMISIGYGSGRRYLGRILETVTGSAGGVSPFFDVTPALPAAIVTGLAVILRRPYGLFIVTEYDPGRSDRIFTRGIAFSALQVPF